MSAMEYVFSLMLHVHINKLRNIRKEKKVIDWAPILILKMKKILGMTSPFTVTLHRLLLT